MAPTGSARWTELLDGNGQEEAVVLTLDSEEHRLALAGVRVFHIPMGLLPLQTPVNQVSKLPIQQLNHRAASLLVKVVLGFVELHFHKRQSASHELLVAA
jgi:hypothetical protein